MDIALKDIRLSLPEDSFEKSVQISIDTVDTSIPDSIKNEIHTVSYAN